MVYLIKTTANNISLIKDRISSNGWSAVSYDTIIFVDVPNENSSQEVYNRLASEDEEPKATIVVKLSDDEAFYYWGRADNSIWDWLKEHSRQSIDTWNSSE